MKMKKLLSLILMVVLCITGVPLNVKADTDTLNGYTPIYTIADLAGINNDTDGNYILMNDIDMTEETKKGGSWDTGHGWTPLEEFSGTFDGNGHRIIGMHIYGEVDSYIGLFSMLRGKIENLGMVNVNIDNVVCRGQENPYTAIGAIAGCNVGKIDKCYVSGSISSKKNDNGYYGYVGGIAGYSYRSISNCYNTANITGNGITNASEGLQLENCYNVGEVIDGGIISSVAYYKIDSVYNLQGKGKEYEHTTPLTEAQMRIQNMYVGFDFENVWEIDPSSSYPYPQLKSNRHQRIEGMELVSAPTKTVYSQGDTIDVSGGTIKLIYEGGYTTTVAITEQMLEEYDTTNIGNQNITVQYGGQKALFPITVEDISVTDIQITGESDYLQKGASMQLKAAVKPENATDATVTWSSSDTKIAAVDETGKVNALQTGDVTITATASNGVSGQYSMKVIAPCVSLLLNQKDITMYKGETATLSAILSPLDTTDTISWKSSNTNIVTVDHNGQLTGYAAGEAKITASAGNVTANCNVTVKQKMDDFYIVGVVDKEYTGDTVEQEVEVTDGVVVLEEDTDYIISYEDNVEVGTAKVQITGIKYYEGSIEQEFVISPTYSSKEIEDYPDTTVSPGKIKSLKIKNSKGKKVKVTFQKVKGVDGYEIRYSTKSNMSGSKMKRTKKTSYTISSLKKKKKYYVQIRTYIYDSGEKVYGKWSTKVSFIKA